MAYYSNASLGLGCGGGCGCQACARASRRLGESYETDDDDDDDDHPARPPAPPATGGRMVSSQPPRPAPGFGSAGFGFSGVMGEAAPRAAAAVPAFRFACPIGCAPQTANACRAIVARAIADAIALAENAANKLERRDGEALRLFRFFFGDPVRAVPWANNKAAADLVAHRYRAVAAGFHTRVPHVLCSADAGCNAFTQPRAAPSTAVPLPHNTILLCPPFWQAGPAGTVTRFWRAAIVLHEMLHLLFWQFFGHQANLPRPGDPEERRRDNSHCYEAFALRVAGHGADPADVTACRARPA
jgi:hypothetical protein